MNALKDLAQLLYYVLAAGAAIWALVVYRRNSALERARWASNLYEKFYEGSVYYAMFWTTIAPRALAARRVR